MALGERPPWPGLRSHGPGMTGSFAHGWQSRTFSPNLQPMSPVILSVLAIVVGTALTWWGSGRLETSSARLARRYRLPAVVQGTLIVAVGSSFPELSTTVLSTSLHGEFELGMAAIVGSAIFNILVIPGVAVLAGGPTEHGLRLVYRDAQFYLTSVAVLLLTFSFAIIYNPVPGDERLSGTLNRLMAVIPLGLYGLYLFLQQQDTADHRRNIREQSKAPEWPKPSERPLRDWGILLVSLVVILVGVEALVRAAIQLGDFFGTPSFVWGATVVAAATSLPDTLVSYRAARNGNTDVSLGNVLGSNIFDLLVAIPAGVMIAGTVDVDYTVAAPLMGMLVFATVVLFTAMRTDLCLTRREAWILLALYVLFVLWAVLESLELIDWVGA